MNRDLNSYRRWQSKQTLKKMKRKKPKLVYQWEAENFISMISKMSRFLDVKYWNKQMKMKRWKLSKFIERLA
jgi:hypothetical protein